jgi:hypothetical protein
LEKGLKLEEGDVVREEDWFAKRICGKIFIEFPKVYITDFHCSARALGLLFP